MFEAMVSRRMAERREEKTKRDKKDKKKKKDEEDSFSGSGPEEPAGTDPAGIMEEMDKEVAAGVMEEVKTDVGAKVMTGMKPEIAGEVAGEMPAEAVAAVAEQMDAEDVADMIETMRKRAPPKRENNRREFAHQRAKLAMKRKVNEMMERRQANNDEHSARRQHGDISTIAAKARAAMRAAKRQQMARRSGEGAPGKMDRRMAERRGDANQAWNRRMSMPRPQAMRRQMMKRRQQKSE